MKMPNKMLVINSFCLLLKRWQQLSHGLNLAKNHFFTRKLISMSFFEHQHYLVVT